MKTKSNMANDENLLRTDEAAERLSLSPNTLRNWRTRRIGPRYVKCGGDVRYRSADLTAFIESNIVEPATI